MVNGSLAVWAGARKVDCLLSSNLASLMFCFSDKTNGSRGSSTVGRRLGWEGRPAPVESFNFPLLFLMILHL